MAIDPNRVEAAAMVLAANDASERPDWGGFRDIASAALAAAFPELSSDPPTGWVAPWEATGRMVGAAVETADFLLGYAKAEELYQAARDAHTKEKT